MLPTVSVIVPTHNRPQLLAAALDSAYAQAGLGESFEFQVIVVDDGSDTDATVGLDQRYPGITTVRLDENVGVTGARNRGLELATGDFVAFLDDDDAWLPEKLCRQLAAFEEYPEAGVVYGQALERSGAIWPKAPQPSGWIFKRLLMTVVSVFHSSTILVRRPALDDVGHFDESQWTNAGEDLDLWFRLAHRWPFVFLPGAFTIDGTAPHGLTSSSVSSRSAEVVLPAVLERAIALLPEEEARELAVEARARLDIDLANWCAHEGQFDSARIVLERSLPAWPTLPTDQHLRDVLDRAMELLAAASPTTRETALAICSAATNVFSAHRVKRWRAERHLLGGVWLATARGALHPPASDRKVAARAVLRAVVDDPRSAVDSSTWKTVLALAPMGAART